MFDLAESTGSKTPIWLPDPDLPFWLERPVAGPFIEGGSIGFNEKGTEIDEQELLLEEKETSLSTDGILDDMVIKSRRDVERHPSSARLRADLGLALLNNGLLNDAAEAFRAALELDPEHFVATVSLARTLIGLQQVDGALDLYQRLMERHPSDPVPIMGLAQVAEIKQDLHEAVELWRRAGDLRPDSAVARSNLGVALLRVGRHHEAIAVLKQAVRADIRRAAIHNALGVAYVIAGQNSRAIRAFRMALAINPRLSEAVQSISAVLISEGHVDQAVEVLDKYLAQVSGDFDAHEQLAQAYAQLGDYKSARTQWLRAIDALNRSGQDRPSHQARLINNLGVCFQHLGVLDEAGKRYKRSIDLSPDVPVPFQNLARVYFVADRPQAAVEILRRCAIHFPYDEETQLMLSYALDRQGRGSEAVAQLRQWTALGNATALAWAILGFMLTDIVRQPAEAIEVLETAHSVWPTDPVVVNNLAYAHLMNHNPKAARTILEAFPKSDGKNDPTYAVILQATWGLLHLWEGEIQEGERAYKQASDWAESRGLIELAQSARQKMHLEVARAYRRMGDIQRARSVTGAGLRLAGERHYRQDLRSLAQELREELKRPSSD